MHLFVLTTWLLAACSSEPPAEPALSTVPSAGPSAAGPSAAAPSAPVVPTAQVDRVEGWGAVLETGGTWYRSRPGSQAAGPKGLITLTPTGSTGACGEVIEPAPGAMVILPEGAKPGTIEEAPAIQAALVKRAAWRLDELLPAADLFTPAPVSPEPSRARGVTIGSVAKVRRHLAPPVLIAAGHRECTGIVAVLSGDAGQALAQHQLPDTCAPLRVLPPSDLDGDGQLELVAWSPGRAALYRFIEGPGDPRLVLLADWTCK